MSGKDELYAELQAQKAIAGEALVSMDDLCNRLELNILTEVEDILHDEIQISGILSQGL